MFHGDGEVGRMPCAGDTIPSGTPARRVTWSERARARSPAVAAALARRKWLRGFPQRNDVTFIPRHAPSCCTAGSRRGAMDGGSCASRTMASACRGGSSRAPPCDGKRSPRLRSARIRRASSPSTAAIRWSRSATRSTARPFARRWRPPRRVTMPIGPPCRARPRRSAHIPRCRAISSALRRRKRAALL